MSTNLSSNRRAYSSATGRMAEVRFVRAAWVEFKNVRGDKGWLYGGANIIAFDMPEEGGFSIVDRQELAFFCEKHVRNEFVDHKRDAYLKKYTRRDREDVISILKLHDIKNLMSYRVWEYDQRY
jgi:hypothetical protein